MRHASVQRAQAEYDSAMELYNQIKKVQEIFLSILKVIQNTVQTNPEKAKEYSLKAWLCFDKISNIEVFTMANVRDYQMDSWFEVYKKSPEEYTQTIASIEEQFAVGKLAQIQVVKAKKAKLEAEKS